MCESITNVSESMIGVEPGEQSCFEVELSAYISKQAELRVNQDSGLQILSWSGCEFAAERRSVGMVIV